MPDFLGYILAGVILAPAALVWVVVKIIKWRRRTKH
jgi:Kef-type K+ transport system membrane component KefB